MDHGKAQFTVGKPVVLEEYGWLDPADKLAWLGVVANPNETRVSVMSEWQEIALNYSMPNMFWQLGVCGLTFGCSTDDGFTIYLNNTVESIPLVYDDAAAYNKANAGL